MTDFSEVIGSLDNQNQEQQKKESEKANQDTANKNTDKIVKAVNSSSKPTRKVKGEVKITNPDLAKTQDIDALIKQLKNNELSTLLSGQKSTVNVDFGAQVSALGDQFKATIDELKKQNNNDTIVKTLTAQFSSLVKQLQNLKPTLDSESKQLLKDVKTSVDNLDVKPVVNVPSPIVKVDQKPVDLSPLTDSLSNISKTLQKQPSLDTSKLEEAVSRVETAIQSLRFPVPNYVLPFASQTGKAVQVKLNDDGSLPITASISTGALATSANQTNASQKTQVVDGSGNVIGATSNALDVNIKSGSSAGVQYTEDAAAAADPVGNAVNLVRKDTPAGIVSTDGDNIAQRGTNYGAAYVQVVNSGGSFVDTFGGGTQYADGVARGTATGTLLMVDDGTNIQSAIGTTAGVLKVDLSVTGANSNKLLVTPDSVALPANQSVNISQINGVTPLMGSGIMGTGSPRVTIASDNDPLIVKQATAANLNATVVGTGTFVTQSTLAAETTKVIGVTRTADGSGNLITSTSNALDINIKSGNLTTLPVTNAGTFAVQATIASGATSIAKAEDVASADADVGVPSMAVRKAAPANTSGTDGDYEMLQMSAGRLWVDASGKTLTVDGSGVTQPVSGTVSITTNSAINVAQINGVTPLMGNGTTGTGSQRVTIASDNTAFPVNSTLSAETTKVIGVTRTADGAGNLLTSNSTTYTAKFGLDANLLGTLGTAFSTAGKVDVKGADGDVFVRQTTGSNLHTVLDSGTLTTLTTLTGITNTVVTDDLAAAATGSAVPANAHYQGLNAQTALPAAASAGNLTGETGDKFGRQVMLNNAMRDIMGTQTTTITASTSETTIITAIASTFNDLVSLFISNTSATATRVDIRDTTAGSVIFQLYIPAGDMRGVSLTTPWPQSAVNTNWTATSSTSVTDLRISALYIKNK